MATSVLMPRLTYEMEEAVIVQWLQGEGDEVQEGDPLFEVETDKAIVTVEASTSGILCGIRAQAGQSVPIAETVAFIADFGEKVPDLGPISVTEVGIEPEEELLNPQTAPKEPETGRISATPIARRIAKQHGIDLSMIVGSGSGAKILEADVQAELERRRGGRLGEMEAPHRIVELSRLRKTTGDRLTASHQSVPHFVLEVNVDMSASDLYRTRYEKQNGQSVSYTSIAVKAVAMALQDYSEVNASFNDGQIKIFDEVNIGIAIATYDGLIVPVIHRANKSTLPEINQLLMALRERANEGKFRPEELVGGTFTISNLGMYGVDAFQAIINPPEAAILALGRIRNIPVGIEGQILLCPIMNMRLSIDHRVLDGVIAARFLRMVKELIEKCQFND